MIKLLTIILFSFLTNFAKGQCDTTPINGMKMTFEVSLNTNRWNYYNANGSLAWGNVNGYDSTLIPKGGYATRITVDKKIDGYGDLKVVNPKDCEVILAKAFDGNLKEIDGVNMSVKSWKFKN